jgi:hypothetical protein
VSLEDLAELEETLSVLSEPEALAAIREADAAYARGDVVRTRGGSGPSASGVSMQGRYEPVAAAGIDFLT